PVRAGPAVRCPVRRARVGRVARCRSGGCRRPASGCRCRGTRRRRSCPGRRCRRPGSAGPRRGSATPGIAPGSGCRQCCCPRQALAEKPAVGIAIGIAAHALAVGLAVGKLALEAAAVGPLQLAQALEAVQAKFALVTQAVLLQYALAAEVAELEAARIAAAVGMDERAVAMEQAFCE